MSGGRLTVSIASHIVGNMSEGQRRHVDTQTWVGLMEHFCQYGKANMVVKIQQICKELELTVPDMVCMYVLQQCSPSAGGDCSVLTDIQTYVQ